jgi:hypothetical protein
MTGSAKQSIGPRTETEEWIASSRSLSSGRPKGRTRWLLAMTESATNGRKAVNKDMEELTALNRDYVASVQNSDVKRFD